jgi:hypothetical protein
MLESTYTNTKLKPRFLAMGCKFKKHPGGRFSSGWPDVEIRWDGEVINIEVKMDDNVVSKLQRRELKSIAKYEGWALVIRKKDGIEYILGIDATAQNMAIAIGKEFERLDPRGKYVYNYKTSPELRDQLKKIMEEK